MEYNVDTPYDCPFQEKDYDGFPDGCKIDGTKCYDEDNFHDDCPLRNCDIIVTKV